MNANSLVTGRSYPSTAYMITCLPTTRKRATRRLRVSSSNGQVTDLGAWQMGTTVKANAVNLDRQVTNRRQDPICARASATLTSAMS